jgi:glycosyltransferase involved in cell wall biosynthesis
LKLIAYTDAFAWGGAEQSLSTLLTALDDRHDVTVVGTDGTVVERIAGHRPGSPVVVLPRFGGKFDVRSITAHVRAFRALDADLCHVNMRTPYACQGGLIASLLTRTPIVAVEHLPLHSPSSLMRWTRRRLAPRYAAHVSVGVESARLVEAEVGLPRGSVGTIYNGVPDVEHQSRPRVADGVVLGSIGRLDEQKNYGALIDTLPELPDATAVIVGEGPAREELEAQASRLGVAERLHLVGWSDEARAYLTTFDVFVLPSIYEGFPLVIIEAMLAGLPVVATDVGSVSEAVEDGATGLVLPPGDVPALVAGIARLVEDQELRARFGDAGRQRATRLFTADVMAAAYQQLYDGIAR